MKVRVPGAWRRRGWLLGGLAVMLAAMLVGAALVLDAGRQREFLLAKASPHVDSIALDYVHVLPWSLELRGLTLHVAGLSVVVQELEAGFNPLPLLGGEASVRRLVLRGAEVDVSRFQSTPTSEAPTFPGVLAVLDQGLGIRLGALDAAVRLTLAPGRVVDLTLQGGGVRPHQAGEVRVVLGANDGEGPRLDVDGLLSLAQLSRGKWRALGFSGEVALAAPGLPRPERLGLSLALEPQPGAGAARHQASLARARGESHPPTPEALRLEITSRAAEAEAPTRATLSLEGTWDGAAGQLDAALTLASTEQLLAPYAPAVPLPGYRQDASARLAWSLPTARFDLALENRFEVRQLERMLGINPALPQALMLDSAVTLAGSPERINVTRFEHQLVDDARTPVLQTRLNGPLQFAPGDAWSLLDVERSLGAVDLLGLPLDWFNGLLGGLALEDGSLRGGLEVVAEPARRLSLVPVQPFSTGAFQLRQGETTLARDLSLEASPSLSLAPERASASLRELSIKAGNQEVLSGSTGVEQSLAADSHPEVAVDLRADLNRVAALPAVAASMGERRLPDGLSSTVRGKVGLMPDQLQVSALAMDLHQAQAPRLLNASSKQMFSIQLNPARKPALRQAAGTLARVSLRGLDLQWLSMFAAGRTLQGTLDQAEFDLAADPAGRYRLEAVAPLRLRGLGVREGGRVLLEDLDLEARPSWQQLASGWQVGLAGLEIRSGSASLLGGKLTVVKRPDEADLEGQAEADLAAWLRQPALHSLLPGRLPSATLQARLDFAAHQGGEQTRFERLAAGLRVGEGGSVALSAEPGLRISPLEYRRRGLAHAVQGVGSLRLRGLGSRTLAALLPLGELRFDAVDADLELRSDGTRLQAQATAPLRLSGVALATEAVSPLAPFSVRTTPTLEAAGTRIDVRLADTTLAFDRAAAPALSAVLDARIETDAAWPLTRTRLRLEADVPQWLAQPGVWRGHSLAAGRLLGELDLDGKRNFTGRVALDGLRAAKALPLAGVEIPVEGQLARDGRGFRFTAPARIQGKSGESALELEARFAPEPEENDLLDLALTGPVFYLNDVLATLAAIAPRIAGEAPPAAAGEAAAPPGEARRLDERRDTRAAWNVLPLGSDLRLALEKVYYTDYLAFDEVRADLDFRRRRLTLNELSARFHESTLQLAGGLRFRAEEAEPYVLALNGTLRDFDLLAFSSELLPGQTPAIEGLFGVTVEASGEMPNLGQLRNRALFDLRLTSRQGVFRPLPSDSVLFSGASQMVLGLLGEGLSYAPSGGFGAGAVARLVNYIAHIDYDAAEIHVRRGSSRRVKLSRFVIQSPTILMRAEGAIDYIPGLDLFDSPLSLEGELNMRGRGAAILYSLDLMREGQDEFGYFNGPQFRITGTASVPESNFAEIVSTAGGGALRGGFTRPLAGLIGNFRYRWFGPDDTPASALPPDSAAEED